MTSLSYEDGKYLDSQKVNCIGPGIAVWHESQFMNMVIDQGDMEFETALPIRRSIRGSGRVKVRELPKGEVAYIVHHGDFSGLPQGKQGVFAWLEKNGYRWNGAIREIYLHHDPGHEANEDSPPACY
jgi:effector-binding domain-containing protein